MTNVFFSALTLLTFSRYTFSSARPGAATAAATASASAPTTQFGMRFMSQLLGLPPAAKVPTWDAHRRAAFRHIVFRVLFVQPPAHPAGTCHPLRLVRDR